MELSNDVLVGILVFVLALTVSINSLGRLIKNKGMVVLAYLAISLLAWRFLTFEQYDFLFSVYGWGGALVAILIPFMIVFWFVYSSSLNGVIRKMIWIFFALIMFVLMTGSNASQEFNTSFTLIAAIVVGVILLIDKWIFERIKFLKHMKGR